VTFEQWWERSGKAVVRVLQARPADSFAAVEQTFRTAIFTGWHAAEANASNGRTPFEAWWEMHEAECKEGRYNKKCFELCWNASNFEAQETLRNQLDLSKLRVHNS
jgi:hypothetical protein